MEAPPAAVLRIIAQISRLNHSLHPQGTYNPPHKLGNEDVRKAKLRFHINAPRDMGFASVEFNTFIENLQAIHDKDVDPVKFPNVKMHQPFGLEDNKGVTVLHPLVVVCAIFRIYEYAYSPDNSKW